LTKRPASDNPPLVRLSDQLTDANRALASGEQRLLLAIDEFEKIDAKIGEGVFPADLLSMVRESIQSHRRIIWAFVGVGDLTELTHAPSSYFVGLRSITVPPFTPEETRRLLTEPLAQSRLWRDRAEAAPRFDPDFWGNGGIERIHTEAGGWPHLVQLLAETAVELALHRWRARRRCPQATEASAARRGRPPGQAGRRPDAAARDRDPQDEDLAPRGDAEGTARSRGVETR
jgi:hypothetical protein